MSNWTTPEEEEENIKELRNKKWLNWVHSIAFGLLTFSLFFTNLSHSGKTFESWVYYCCAGIQIIAFGILFFKLDSIERTLKPMSVWYKNKFKLKGFGSMQSGASIILCLIIGLGVLVFFYGLYVLTGISIYKFFTG